MVTGSTANTRASAAGEDPAPSAILWSCTALMGTAAAVAARSDPGSVRARGRRAADQITPEPPEERPPQANRRRADRPGRTLATPRNRGPEGARQPARLVPPEPPACGPGRPLPRLTFPDLPAVADLPAIEHEVLARWRDGEFFRRSLEQTAAGPLWTFYEGPPTANGTPGVHHVEARVFKDAFPRFKTMRGFHVPRRAGWDCHGLPVEVAVEKELGLASKKDIEAYGIREFNERCRESVLRHVDAFAAMTERMGYWVDLATAYRTMDASYIESVWWSLKVSLTRAC